MLVTIQIGRTSAHLRDLGLSENLVGYVWLAGPISGIVMQPIVGVLSDRCRSSFGRRRPFMLGGALMVAVSLVLFSNAADIASYLGDPPHAAGHGSRTSIALALGAFWTLDFAINALQAPTRALLADVVHPSQLSTGNACFAAATGIGKTIAYTLGSLAPDIRTVYFVGAVIILVFSLLPSILVHERAIHQDDDAFSSGPCSTLIHTMSEVWSTLRGMQRSFRTVFIAQFLSCTGFMLVFIYVTLFFGQLNGGIADAPIASPEYARFEAGVLRANRALLFMSVLSMVLAPIIPTLARVLGTRLYWGGSQVGVGIALACTLLHPSVLVAELIVVSVGLPLSNAMTIPWTITALDAHGELAQRRGLHFAVFNLAQAIPGLFASFLSSFVVTITKNLASPLALAGAFSLAGAVATICVSVPNEMTAVPVVELDTFENDQND